jgi:outer membrane protein assembly factor BamE (lipoprotein component of BamABCDE complex)
VTVLSPALLRKQVLSLGGKEMKNVKYGFFVALVMVLFCAFAGLSSDANAQVRKVKTTFAPASDQPLYTEYKGVRLGMTAVEARAKLGTPALKESDQDYYVFSDKETAQIVYNAAGKVVTISIDYLGGVGAPDYKTVVGGELEETPNGGLYKIVRYESKGFWVSYNRSPGPVSMVTITIQKI